MCHIKSSRKQEVFLYEAHRDAVRRVSPVTVMLMALLLSLCLDSHQYTPLSSRFSDFTLQVEEVWVPHPRPH